MNNKTKTVFALTIFCVIQFYITRAEMDIDVVEKEFYNHYKETNVTVPFTDLTKTFCEFVRPAHLDLFLESTKLNTEKVTLVTLANEVEDNVINVQILTCIYENVLGFTELKLWYAQSPTGKHFEMRQPGIGSDFENFAIAKEVAFPLENVEKIFYNYYTENQDVRLKWPVDNLMPFCLPLCPVGFSLFGMHLITEDIVLFSQALTKVTVQMLGCEYKKKTSETGNDAPQQYIDEIDKYRPRTQKSFPFMSWYVKGPNNKIYELRQFGNVANQGLAICREH